MTPIEVLRHLSEVCVKNEDGSLSLGTYEVGLIEQAILDYDTDRVYEVYIGWPKDMDYQRISAMKAIRSVTGLPLETIKELYEKIQLHGSQPIPNFLVKADQFLLMESVFEPFFKAVSFEKSIFGVTK